MPYKTIDQFQAENLYIDSMLARDDAQVSMADDRCRHVIPDNFNTSGKRFSLLKANVKDIIKGTY